MSSTLRHATCLFRALPIRSKTTLPSRQRTIPSSRAYTSARTESRSATPTPPSPKAADMAAAAPYPHRPAQWFKQSNAGLYGGTRIQFGNNVSDKNEIKTRRHWLPNIRKKHLYSQSLARSVQVRVSTRVLRTIDKVGGLDAYLLGGTAARIKDLGVTGWRLRCQVIASSKMQKVFNGERDGLGLPRVDYEALAAEAVAADAPTHMGRLTGLGRKSKRIIRRRF